MRAVSVLAGVATAVTVAGWPARAQAQAEPRETVDALVVEANALAANGDFVSAGAKFQDAYAVEPRPELICNAGVAYRKAHDLPRAQHYLTTCAHVGTALDSKFITALRAALTAVENDMRAGDYEQIVLAIEPSAGAIVIGDWGERERLVGSQVVWLAFGAHQLYASADGYRNEQRTITVAAHDPLPVTFTLVRTDAVTSPPPLPPPIAITPPPRTAIQPPPAAPSHAAVAIGAAITGVALVTTVALYLETHHKIDAIDTDGTRDAYQHAADTASHWRDGYFASAAVTVVAAGVTAYLWAHARPSARTEVDIAPTAGGATALVSGRF